MENHVLHFQFLATYTNNFYAFLSFLTTKLFDYIHDFDECCQY